MNKQVPLYQRPLKLAAVAMATLAFTACGGGGSSDSQGSTYSVSGTVSGLNVDGLVLSNGSDTLAVPASTSTQTYAASLASGTSYDVQVASQPVGFSKACQVVNGTGTVGSANISNVQVQCLDAAARVAAFVGSPVGYYDPNSMAVAPDGSAVYLTDHSDGVPRILKVVNGVVSVLAITSTAFDFITGLTVGADGTVYAINTDKRTVIMVTASGVVSTLAGTNGISGANNGPAASATFNGPEGLAVDAAGNVYVADRANHLIRKITKSGSGNTATYSVSTLAGTTGVAGNTNHTDPLQASFNNPAGLAVDASGHVYVADPYNTQVRKINASTGAVSTLAGGGTPGDAEQDSTDGTGATARLTYVSHIAVDALGHVFVLAGDSNGYRQIDSTTGNTTTVATSVMGNMIAADAAGKVYLMDGTHNDGSIRARASNGTETNALLPGHDRLVEGTGATARFHSPKGLGTDAAGNVYVADAGASRVLKVTPAGVVSTLAGSGTSGNADATAGHATDATFESPTLLAVDNSGTATAGTVYVVGTAERSQVLRKIATNGAVTTLASSSATVNAMAVGSDGTVYLLTDSATGTEDILRFSPSGTALASLSSGTAHLSAMALDAQGNLYVSTNTVLIKIAPGQAAITLAGSAVSQAWADGQGADARFAYISALSTDTMGNVYAVDKFNVTVRKVTPTGLVSSLAGDGTFRAALDGVAGNARFGYLTGGIAVDAKGQVYVVDDVSVRKITSVYDPAPATVVGPNDY